MWDVIISTHFLAKIRAINATWGVTRCIWGLWFAPQENGTKMSQKCHTHVTTHVRFSPMLMHLGTLFRTCFWSSLLIFQRFEGHKFQHRFQVAFQCTSALKSQWNLMVRRVENTVDIDVFVRFHFWTFRKLDDFQHAFRIIFDVFWSTLEASSAICWAWGVCLKSDDF